VFSEIEARKNDRGTVNLLSTVPAAGVIRKAKSTIWP
jgi:hypothetical protein